MGRGRHIAALLLGAAAVAAPARGVHADDVDDAARRVSDLSNQAAELDASLRPPPPPSADEADRRLVDAEVQYGLKNYGDASILLFDIVERWPGGDAYKEALWYLADCLYQKGDYLTARKYLNKLVTEVGAASPHYQPALAKLLEIAVKTKDEATGQEALQQLDAIPAGQQDPLVPYAKGKFAFAESRWSDATTAFESIPTGSPYYFRGRYFLGASYVAAGELPQAAEVFAALTQAAPQSAQDTQIVDLAHLALGRVLYERGELDKAAHEYQSVSQHSPQFVDALYEIAWVYVKGGTDASYERALRAIDLCLLADPTADTAAEAELLQGNLEIRLAKEAESTDMFQKVKDQFAPIRTQIDATFAQHEDPVQFFRRIIASSDATFAIDAGPRMPPLALKWIREQPTVVRITAVSSDEDEIKQDLTDAGTTIQRLEQVVSSPERVNVFPELARARETSATIATQNDLLRSAMAARYHDLVAGVATPAEQQQLEQYELQRTAYEKELQNLPTSADSLQERIAKQKARYQSLEQEQAKVRTIIDGLQAEMVAIRKYYQDTRAQQHEPRAQFDADVAAVQAEIDKLNQAYNDLENAIESSKNSVGVMDAEGQAEQQLKLGLKGVVDKEEALEAGLQQRLAQQSPDAAQKAAQVDSVLEKCDGVDGQLTAVNKKIDDLVDAQLESVKTDIADAKAKVATYEQQLTSDETETAAVGTVLVQRSAHAVADRVYDIVVRADVGLVDVAWALKEEKVDAYKQVADEEARETKLLDDAYQDLVKDDTTASRKGGGL